MFSPVPRKSVPRSNAPGIYCKRRPLFQALRLLCSSIGRLRFSLPIRLVFPLLLATSALAQDPSTVGQWSTRTTWPFKAVHAALLPTGKVLWWPSFADGDNPYLWDPATNTNTALPQVGANIFCAGLSFQPD